MDLKSILKFQFKRVNPFPGLVIDADTWRDAHNYSRDQQRLHNLVFHQVGIVRGLEVTSNDPQDLSVNINPGIAIDPEGNTIIVPNTYHYQIQNRDEKTIYLIIQFREVLEGPYQPPDGGEPTRIVDGYRIQERDNLPEEPYLELARIDFAPDEGIIRDAGNRQKPGKNEIDLNFRKEAEAIMESVTSKETTVSTSDIINPEIEIILGHAVVDDNPKDLHVDGLRNLAKELGLRYKWVVNLEDNIDMNEDIKRFTIIYLTGSKYFELSEEQQSALKGFLESGGVIFGEDCFEGDVEASYTKEFGLAFNELAVGLKSDLQPVQRGNPLLTSVNVFSQIPQGAKSGVLLEGGQIIYSGSDYGCAWQGGHKDTPLSRDFIRSTFEIGANIIHHAYTIKTSVRLKNSVLT